jgi:histidine triad (HIT) family protein
MKDCVFCKIVRGEIYCVKIWEDKNYLAFLDIMPFTEGMTLVIPKKHYESNLSKLSDSDYSKLFLAAKKVIKILEKGVGAERIAIVVEGLDVNHAHVKLYPIFKVGEEYRGLSFKSSPKKSSEELQRVAEKILANNKVFK